MREISYRDFSAARHRRTVEAGRATDCQFELTFHCDYRCPHCLTACFDRPGLLRKELKTSAVLALLDKMRRAGVVWLSLTGGDPMTRPDFPDIYSASLRMGFITTVMTNGLRVTPEIAALWRGMPPFVVEMTVNAHSEALYDRISGRPGSFRRMREGLRLLRRSSVAVKLKMQVTAHNVHELPLVRRWARGQGLPLMPSFLLHPRLDGDKAPCRLRVLPPKAAEPSAEQGAAGPSKRGAGKPPLFPCAIGCGARWYVDPYGFGFLCNMWRAPGYDLLTVPLGRARSAALASARGRRYQGDPVCPSCAKRDHCPACPGLAFLETGDPEAVVPYYCGLAR